MASWLRYRIAGKTEIYSVDYKESMDWMRRVMCIDEEVEMKVRQDKYGSLVAMLDDLSECSGSENKDEKNENAGTIHQVLCDICLNILSNAREINRISSLVEGGHESIQGDIEMKRLVSKSRAVRGQAMMTGREKDVIVQLLEGKTNREISRELRIDEKTVKITCGRFTKRWV